MGDPGHFLFTAPKVDQNWLREFNRSLAVDKSWLLRCDQEVAARYATDEAARDGYSRIGWAFAQNGRYAEAKTWYERDWESDRMRRWQFVRYLEVLLGLGSQVEATERVMAYYAQHPDAKDGWAAIGSHHAASGDISGARDYYRRDLESGRLSSILCITLADYEGRLGNWDDAEKLVVRAYSESQELRDGYARLGEVKCRSGNLEAALEFYARDKESDRLSANAALRYARLLWQAGDVNGAIECMQREENADRHTPESMLLHAEYRLRTGDDHHASRLAASAIRRRPLLAGQWRRITDEVAKSPVPNLDRLIADILDGCRGSCGTLTSYMRSNAGRIARDFRYLQRYVRPTDHIVDVGCSPPLLLALLREKGFHALTGIDPFLNAVEPFLSRQGIRCYETPVDRLPVGEIRQNVDVVCLCEVIEHLTTDLIELFENVRAVLREGGRLYLTTPNLRSMSGIYSLIGKHSGLASKPHDTVRDQFERTRGPSGYFGHLREYTVREIVQLVESCGFRHVVSHMDPCSVLSLRMPMLVRLLEHLVPSWRVFGAHVFVVS